MDDEVAIKVDHVSKIFRLPHEKQSSLKGALINFGKRGYEKQKVLDDVSFEIKKGEFFGIVGRNGSGKSTLLKMLAGIYTPSKGGIHINGKLTPFIELGVGFNPELTGRENVFLNGSLLGFNRKEMAAMYDDIVKFAELERFMDQKLKNYSSGMQVRLAFSIAIQAKNDILVLDEVLAVGDAAFQQKCIKIFEEYKARQQTIVLVTHDMSVVERFCSRSLMIQDGKLIKIGNSGEVARLYSEANKNAYAQEQQRHEDQLAQRAFNLKILDNVTKRPKKRFTIGEIMRVNVRWEQGGVYNVGVAIMKRSGEYVFGPNTDSDGISLNPNEQELGYTVELNLAPGEYYIKSGLFGKDISDIIEFIDEGPSFVVEAAGKAPMWGGLTNLKHKWVQ